MSQRFWLQLTRWQASQPGFYVPLRRLRLPRIGKKKRPKPKPVRLLGSVTDSGRRVAASLLLPVIPSEHPGVSRKRREESAVHCHSAVAPSFVLSQSLFDSLIPFTHSPLLPWHSELSSGVSRNAQRGICSSGIIPPVAPSFYPLTLLTLSFRASIRRQPEAQRGICSSL